MRIAGGPKLIQNTIPRNRFTCVEGKKLKQAQRNRSLPSGQWNRFIATSQAERSHQGQLQFGRRLLFEMVERAFECFFGGGMFFGRIRCNHSRQRALNPKRDQQLSHPLARGNIGRLQQRQQHVNLANRQQRPLGLRPIGPLHDPNSPKVHTQIGVALCQQVGITKPLQRPQNAAPMASPAAILLMVAHNRQQRPQAHKL